MEEFIQIGSFRWTSVMIFRTKIQTVKIISILIKCICLHACSVCEDKAAKGGWRKWQTLIKM